MIKAGKSVLLAVILLLVATPQINAQDFPKVSLITVQEKADVCTSPLKPYVLTRSKDCPVVEQRQVQFLGNVKVNKAEEFSVAHSIQAAKYTPPVKIVSELKITGPTPIVIVSEQNVTHLGNSSDAIFELINQHRTSIGKVPFIKDEALCSLSQTRSNELANEMSRGVLHSGLYNRNLGYWVTENAKTGGDEKETVRWWLNSPIHRSAIQSDYVYSCGGCTGNNCSQLFTSFDPKGNKVAAVTAK